MVVFLSVVLPSSSLTEDEIIFDIKAASGVRDKWNDPKQKQSNWLNMYDQLRDHIRHTGFQQI